MVDWTPLVLRIYEPVRIVYPFHVIDDDSVDNVSGYTALDVEKKVVPVGPRVADFYKKQYLKCKST